MSTSVASVATRPTHEQLQFDKLQYYRDLMLLIVEMFISSVSTKHPHYQACKFFVWQSEFQSKLTTTRSNQPSINLDDYIWIRIVTVDQGTKHAFYNPKKTHWQILTAKLESRCDCGQEKCNFQTKLLPDRIRRHSLSGSDCVDGAILYLRIFRDKK